MAFVEYITVLISTSIARKGMNSSHALSQSFAVAGYLAPHFSAMSTKLALAAFAFTHG